MEAKEIIELIASLDDQGIASREPQALSQLNSVYATVFGESIDSGCDGCIRKAYGKLQMQTIKTITIMQESKFKLQPDVVLPFGEFGSGEFTTNANLTDERAYATLKQFPSFIQYFEEYPKDEDGNLLPEAEEKAPAKGKTAKVTPIVPKPTQAELDAALNKKNEQAGTFVPLDGGLEPNAAPTGDANASADGDGAGSGESGADGKSGENNEDEDPEAENYEELVEKYAIAFPQGEQEDELDALNDALANKEIFPFTPAEIKIVDDRIAYIVANPIEGGEGTADADPLEAMSVPDLKAEFEKVTGKPAKARDTKAILIKAINDAKAPK